MWVIIILLSLIIILILILAVPLDLAFRINVQESPRLRMRLVWLFGLVHIDLNKKEEQSPKSKDPGKDKEKLKQNISATTIFKILKIKGLSTQVKKLLKRIFSSFHIKELTANLRVGLENPADAGILYAYAIPVNLLLNSSSRCNINIWPSFDGEYNLKGFSHGTFRLRPLQLIPPLIRFALSSPGIKTIKAAMIEWKRKK